MNESAQPPTDIEIAPENQPPPALSVEQQIIANLQRQLGDFRKILGILIYRAPGGVLILKSQQMQHYHDACMGIGRQPAVNIEQANKSGDLRLDLIWEFPKTPAAESRAAEPAGPPVEEIIETLKRAGFATDEATVSGWTLEQKQQALGWASAVDLSASGIDVHVPERPAFILIEPNPTPENAEVIPAAQ